MEEPGSLVTLIAGARVAAETAIIYLVSLEFRRRPPANIERADVGGKGYEWYGRLWRIWRDLIGCDSFRIAQARRQCKPYLFPALLSHFPTYS